ncbi:MAG: nucleoside transporter C-terminal domain-containing protein [Thermodesulfobacteriota bacterium]
MQQAPLYYNLISLAGLLVLVIIARLCGLRRGPMAWRTLAWGLGLQLALGALVFALPAGRSGLVAVNTALVNLLEFSRAGVHFLFGPLAIGPGQPGSLGFILALQALPTVIFFMALTALLYQAGILQRVVRWFSAVFVRSLGSSGAESLGVASLIFVGVESAGMVRPFLPTFTRSEFFCLLTAAMSTVASSTLGIYVATLHQSFPNIAGHLVSASLISAPAAIVVAKLMEPETGQPLTAGQTVDPALGKYAGFMEAVITGSNDGVKLLVGIVALLISFLGLVALANGLVGWVGGLLGAPGLSLESILGWLGYPLALIMGVPPADAAQVGALLGQRALVTEIPAYSQLAKLLAQHGLTYGRSALLASYALCGFAHVASVAIFVGGFGALAPGRLGELSRLGLKALWAATLATVMTGCIAGIFASGGASLLGLGN